MTEQVYRPKFIMATVRWIGSDRNHAVMNIAAERSSRYAQCGARIGPDAVYDYHPEGLGDCPGCLADVQKMAVNPAWPEFAKYKAVSPRGQTR